MQFDRQAEFYGRRGTVCFGSNARLVTGIDAARPMVVDIYHDRFNSHVLAISPYPPQVVFCNAEVSGLDDLKGKKITVHDMCLRDGMHALAHQYSTEQMVAIVLTQEIQRKFGGDTITDVVDAWNRYRSRLERF